MEQGVKGRHPLPLGSTGGLQGPFDPLGPQGAHVSLRARHPPQRSSTSDGVFPAFLATATTSGASSGCEALLCPMKTALSPDLFKGRGGEAGVCVGGGQAPSRDDAAPRRGSRRGEEGRLVPS